ncbi:hypothetical protein HX017_01175 [Myroides marinus]|uniref:hypothetical protein n=1 Tax=Myroides marinus TaxID=703342 RepID=UPI002576FEC2|nr:hypothetical protein [Myroides marinus]MDM1345403.1 hypothetical protein [Myroides marinus]MDM1348992.1 hypothetical protein [Myroides marinus]MDM1356202.1 hypothetical protein [Myroides marinus]MDM1360141.1 hypothetical protein [Myroides marinus]MDM1363565.1 hypothetical protein [Myroides marinus]
MKNILKYFTVMLLIVAAVGCSKEDDTVEDSGKKELFIKPDKTKVAIGELVAFTAMDETNNKVDDANFYLNGAKISKDFKFDKKGVYNVVARKLGYKASAPVSIFVSDGGEVIANKLKLTVDKNTVYLGESVKFTVTADGKEVEGAKIQYIEGGTLESSTLVMDKFGTYRFVATKEGYSNSEILEVKVLLKPSVTDQTFTINGVKYDIKNVELTIDVDKNTKKPILYKEGKEAYYVYKLFADNVEGTFAMYIMKVVVPNDTDKVILPYEVPANKVEILGGLGVIDREIEAEILSMDIEKAYAKWLSPLTSLSKGKGEVEYEFISVDYALEVKYKGVYNGLGIVNVNPGDTSKSLKIERRNTGFSFEELKKEIKNR